MHAIVSEEFIEDDDARTPHPPTLTPDYRVSAEWFRTVSDEEYEEFLRTTVGLTGTIIYRRTI
jgi:hypothetical protein